MSRNRAAALIALVASFAFLFKDVIVKLSRTGRLTEYSTRRPLVLYIVWKRRDGFTPAPARPALAGLRSWPSTWRRSSRDASSRAYLTRLAMLGTLAGITVFIWVLAACDSCRSLLLLFLAFKSPRLSSTRSHFLQLLASRFGETAIAACGIPCSVKAMSSRWQPLLWKSRGVQRHPVAHVACDAGARLGLLRQVSGLAARLLAGGHPIAIFSNAVRVAGTGGGPFVGREAAEGFLHTFSADGPVVAGILMLAVHRLAIWLARKHRRTAGARSRQPIPIRLKRRGSGIQGLVAQPC
jgi:hypothetical protein